MQNTKVSGKNKLAFIIALFLVILAYYFILHNVYMERYDIEKRYINYEQEDGVAIGELLNEKILTYEEYTEYCKEFKIKQRYSNENKNYVVFAVNDGELDIQNISTQGNTIYIDGIHYAYMYLVANSNPYFIIVTIPIDKTITKLDLNIEYS